MSGQSNTGLPMSNTNDSAPYIADAANHNVRLFRMTAGNGPSASSWQISTPTTADDFSAVGYWAGLELALKPGVPVGLIQATHDGTNISAWQTTNGGNGHPTARFAVRAEVPVDERPDGLFPEENGPPEGRPFSCRLL